MECKNCDGLISLSISYCPNCGAKIIRNRLTIKNLFGSFVAQFLNYDNKLLQTFITLFKRPEEVINGYINGVRKKYVNVISYFAIAITLSGLQIYVMQKFPMDMGNYLNPDPNLAKIQQEMNESIFKTVSEYQSLIMMLYMPFYALLARLIFLKNKTLNYTETMVLFMYAQAQISIVLAILTIIIVPIGVSMMFFGLAIVPIQILYFAYCLKRVYNLSFAQILLKTLIFLIILGIIFVIITAAASYFMYQSGMFDEMIEAQKQAREARKAAGMLSHFFL